MRAIKIDPATRRISEIELIRNPNRMLDEICLLIGCSRLELIQLDRGIVLAADADGRQKPMRGAFTFIGNHDLVIHGKGIVLGGEGRCLRTLREGKASFDMITEWLTPVDSLKIIPTIQPADAGSMNLAGCTKKQRANVRKGINNEHERENRNGAD